MANLDGELEQDMAITRRQISVCLWGYFPERTNCGRKGLPLQRGKHFPTGNPDTVEVWEKSIPRLPASASSKSVCLSTLLYWLHWHQSPASSALLHGLNSSYSRLPAPDSAFRDCWAAEASSFMGWAATRLSFLRECKASLTDYGGWYMPI